MGGPHQGRPGDRQHEPDEVEFPGGSGLAAPADLPDMSERVAAVVRAFQALREARRLPDPTPTITPPAGTGLPPPPAGPPLPRRVRGAGTVRPLRRAGDAAPSRGGASGAEAPRANGTGLPPAVAPPAKGDGSTPGVSAPGTNDGRVPVTGEASAADRERRDPADPAVRPAERAAAVSALDGVLLDLAAMAVAVGAFVAPWAWIITVAAAAVAGVAAAAFARGRPSPRTLARRTGQRVAAWLRPRSLVWLPVLMARVLLVSIALPFAAGAGRWLAEHGSEGAVAAGRAAAWHHGFRVAAAGICFLLVAGSGAAHDRRIRALRRWLQPLGALGVTSLVVMAVVLVVWTPLLAPRLGGGRLAGADGLAWAPPSLRDDVDRVRDAVVRAELSAATVCLSERQDVRWDSTYTSGNSAEERDVATLRTEQADPAAGEVATAIVAVHNQLAPWVEDIEVVAGDASVARIERRRLPTSAPVDHVPLGATTADYNLLSDGLASFDRNVALRCSAGAVL